MFLKFRRQRVYCEPPKNPGETLVLRKRPRLVSNQGNLSKTTGVCGSDFGHLSYGLFHCERCLQVLCPRCMTAHRREHFLLRIDPYFADEKAS